MYQANYPEWLSELSPEQRSVLQAPWRGPHGVRGAVPDGGDGRRWTGGRPSGAPFWDGARQAEADTVVESNFKLTKLKRVAGSKL